MKTRRYEGWNLHRYMYRWYCWGCGRVMYESDYAWYYGVANGPYCERCKESLKTEDANELGVLTHNP